MGALTKTQILDADDRPCREVEVPEWGGAVRIRALSGAEAEHVLGAAKADKGAADNTEMAHTLVAMSLVDDNGVQLLSSDTDRAALKAKGWQVIRRLFEACCDLNGFTADAAEDLAGNLPVTTGDDSGSP